MGMAFVAGWRIFKGALAAGVRENFLKSLAWKPFSVGGQRWRASRRLGYENIWIMVEGPGAGHFVNRCDPERGRPIARRGDGI
jgi:hypothetical protein